MKWRISDHFIIQAVSAKRQIAVTDGNLKPKIVSEGTVEKVDKAQGTETSVKIIDDDRLESDQVPFLNGTPHPRGTSDACDDRHHRCAVRSGIGNRGLELSGWRFSNSES